MPNIKLMESGLPVAPLKIGALESCRELGEKVNDYIVQFRKSAMNEAMDSPLPAFRKRRSKRSFDRINQRCGSFPHG